MHSNMQSGHILVWVYVWLASLPCLALHSNWKFGILSLAWATMTSEPLLLYRLRGKHLFFLYNKAFHRRRSETKLSRALLRVPGLWAHWSHKDLSSPNCWTQSGHQWLWAGWQSPLCLAGNRISCITRTGLRKGTPSSNPRPELCP